MLNTRRRALALLLSLALAMPASAGAAHRTVNHAPAAFRVGLVLDVGDDSDDLPKRRRADGGDAGLYASSDRVRAGEEPARETYVGGALILGALIWRYWPRRGKEE